MEYYFLINPVAGKRDVTREFVPLVRAAAARQGIAEAQLHILSTQYRGHAREMARQAAESGQTVRIYAVGGDGTFNEAVTGAMGHENAAVGCLPYGSGNDFLRSYGTQEEFLDLDGQLRGGVTPIDLIETQRGYAASLCSAGLDAQVAYGIPKFRRLPLCGGEMAYRLSIIKEVLGKRSRRMRFTVDGQTREEDCLMVAVCNGHAYGGGFIAAPEARLDDGVLDVYAVRSIPLAKIVQVLPIYQAGKHFRQGQVIPELQDVILYFPARQVEIQPVDGAGPIIVNVDGECGPDEGLCARVCPLAAQILLPEKVFARQPAAAVRQN